MANEEEQVFVKDFEYLFKLNLNPNKMSIDEIVNYIDSCSNGSDRMFIYNAYYFMLKRIPDKAVVADTERAFGDPKTKEGAKRFLITGFKGGSEYCDVWLSPQENFVNDLTQKWQSFLDKFKRKKLNYQYCGYIDTISRQIIAGWAWNILDPQERVMVDIYGDGKLKISLCANVYREDLKLNGVGDGVHGWGITPVPEELLNCSTIVIKIQKTGEPIVDNYLGIFRD